MKWSLLPLFAGVLPSLAAAAPAGAPTYQDLKPSVDPIYVGTVANLSTYAPAGIIRQRQLPNNLTALLPSDVVINIGETWQILYRTSDIFNDPAVAVATIWVPANGDPNKLLSYQPPWDSPDLNCASSYELQNGYLFSRAVERQLPANLLPMSALNLGWYMVLPDHEGIIAALGSGVTGGYATLDGIRAALNSANFTGVSPSAKIALSGYSGGAPPSEFAAELQHAYAPELNIVGTAIGGINPNSVQQLDLNQFPDLEFETVLGQILGLSNAYPNLTTYLTNNLDPAFAAEFNAPRYTCAPTTTLDTLNRYFKNPITAISDPVMQSVWIWGTTWGRRGTPTAPLYVYQAINGPLATSYPDDYVRQMCAQGVSVEYNRNSATDHDSESIIGNAGQLEWLQDRFDGVPAAAACTTVKVSTTTLAAAQKTLYGDVIYTLLAKAAEKTQDGEGI